MPGEGWLGYILNEQTLQKHLCVLRDRVASDTHSGAFLQAEWRIREKL